MIKQRLSAMQVARLITNSAASPESSSLLRAILRQLASWRYAQVGSRDDRLDFMRGYAMAVITVNHVVVVQSFFHLLSGNLTFYTSAAEQFYAISGVVLGMITLKLSLSDAARKVLRRAFELYVIAVGIGLVFGALAWFTDLRLWYDAREFMPPFTRWGIAHFTTFNLTLRAVFHGGDILGLYAIYMAVTPLALWAFKERRSWIVLLVSLTVYAISQIYPPAVDWPFEPFPIAAWQPLFFGGLFLGYHHEHIKQWIRRIPVLARWLIAVTLLACAIFFIYVRAMDYALLPVLPALYGERDAMRPAHLVLAFLYLVAFYLLVTLVWKPLSTLFGWLFLTLGRASLWSFTAHIVVIVIIYNTLGFTNEATGLTAAFWHVLAIMMVWGSVKAREWLRHALPPPLKTRRAVLGASAAALVSILQIRCGTFPCATAAEIVDDTSAGWRWHNMSSFDDPRPLEGSAREAYQTGASADYTFVGKQVELFGWKGKSGGVIEVFLDDQSQGRFDLVASHSFNRMRVFISQQLPYGEHTIRVVAKTDDRVVVDYLKVK